ncbi:MAG: AarF/UbiB family protein [Actinomycetota bacterium]|nr:AarF/UbiB family protein [Actinomycetota bacterium]
MGAAGTDFEGPFARGAPLDALRIDAPSLTRFGLAEVRRVIVGVWILGSAILAAMVTRWVALARHRPHKVRFVALAEGAVDGFERLGPGWVKIGQIIASSPGMFPAPLADACQRTLDEVPPFDAATAHRILTEDLGRPPEDLFTRFDDRPLSAASVGQVHACVLPDGRDAVVKLQRPGIRHTMTVDLRIMYQLARVLERFGWLKITNPIAIVEDAHALTFQELNPALEATRQAAFRSHIGAFGDNTCLTVPEVYWDFCGPRVICMERLFGIPMDEFDELARRGVDGELAMRRGSKVWIESVIVHGPFHGDMHAGNIWVLDDGRSAFLDFGIMGELPQLFRDVMSDLLYTTMIDGDFTRVARAYRRAGVFPEQGGTDEELGMQLGMIMGPLLASGMKGLNLGELIKTSVDLMGAYHAQAPKELLLIAKQLAYIERYAKGLAPDYALVKDLFLVKNIFPAEVARLVEERALTLPQ